MQYVKHTYEYKCVYEEYNTLITIQSWVIITVKKVSCNNSSSYNNSTQNVGEIVPLGGLKYIRIITAHKMLMKWNP